MMRIGLVLCSSIALAACASRMPAAHSTSACVGHERAMVRETLYFGRNRPDGGVVGDEEWQSFVDDAITPAFPDGFTVWRGDGQWRGGDGRIVREASQVVTILHAGDAPSTQAVADIVEAYKRRFRQEAVLRERSSTCALF